MFREQLLRIDAKGTFSVRVPARIRGENFVKLNAEDEKMLREAVREVAMDNEQKAVCNNCKHVVVQDKDKSNIYNWTCGCRKKEPEFSYITGELTKPAYEFHLCMEFNASGGCEMFEEEKR